MPNLPPLPHHDITSNAPHERKPWHIDECKDRHQEIARRLVVGQAPDAIAADLGISAQTVYQTKRSPVMMEKMRELHAARDIAMVEQGQKFLGFANDASDEMHRILQSPEEPGSTRLRAAEAILDRAGLQLEKTLNVNNRHSVQDEVLEIVKRRARESGLMEPDATDTIEAEFTTAERDALQPVSDAV